MVLKTRQGYQVVNSISGKLISVPVSNRDEAEKINTEYIEEVKERVLKWRKKTFEYWLHAVNDRNDARANYELGLLYYHGRGIEKNTDKAEELFHKAANKGITEAEYFLGLCYKDYQWNKHDTKEGYKWLLKAAKKGHSAAQYEIGRYYHYGNISIPVAKDITQEFEWYCLSANGGYVEAQSKLGYFYAYGYAGTTDISKAIECWSKAADQGNNYAVTAIIAYCEEKEIDLDFKVVFNWRLIAASKGDSNAAYQLAICFQEGIGCEPNIDESLKWKMIAAQRGHQYACLDLGLMYMDGDIVEQDYSESLLYLKKISDCWPEAMFWIGIHYFDGLGTSQDFKLAHQWFVKASDLGYPPAQYQLGLCYENGQGVKANDKYAMEYFRRAANRGHGGAQYRVGLYYTNGIGAIQDHQNAYFWLYLASKYECEEAIGGLRSVARHLTTAQKENIRAAANKWMKDLEYEELLY